MTSIYSQTMETYLETVYGTSYTSLDRLTQIKLNKLIWQHMFRVLDYSTLIRKLVRFGLNGSTLSLRRYLVSDGKIFQLKLALYRIFSTNKEPLKVYNWYRISEQDRRVHLLLKSDPILVRGLRAYSKQGFCSFSQRKWSKLLEQAVSISETYTVKYVKRKMRFILTSNGFDPHDLSSILVEEGIKAMMNMYPCFKSDLHAINVMKSAIHNQGQNLIDKFTTAKRNSLVQGSDGTFSTLKVALHDVVSGNSYKGDVRSYLDGVGNLVVGVGSANPEELSTIESKACANSLISKAPFRYKRLMNLMTGKYDEGFTRYLQSQKVICEESTNEDLMDGCVKSGKFLKYKNPAFDFLGIPRDEAKNYLDSLNKDVVNE